MQISSATVIEILSKLDADMPPPEITKIVGDNEDWYEVRDYCLEWCTARGHVDLSLYFSSGGVSQHLYVFHKDLDAAKAQPTYKGEQYMLKGEEITTEILNQHLRRIYGQ